LTRYCPGCQRAVAPGLAQASEVAQPADTNGGLADLSGEVLSGVCYVHLEFDPPHVQWYLTILMIAGSAWLFLVKWKRDWGKPFNPAPSASYPTEDAYVSDIKSLPEECKASESLADRGKDLFSSYLDSMKALDDKAAAILGFVGGGAGLIALASGTEKPLAHPVVTPLLVLASVYLFGVLASAIAVQLPRNRGSVNVERLCDVAVMTSPKGKSIFDALVGREYIEASRKAVVVLRQKAVFLAIAQILFSFGVAALVANALAPIKTETPKAVDQAYRLHCYPARGHLDCNLTPPKESK
jgi:hypothetical protein